MIDIRISPDEAWINGQRIKKPAYMTAAAWRTYGPRHAPWIYRGICMDTVLLDANLIKRPASMGRSEWLEYWERDNLPGEISFSEAAWRKRYPNAISNADRYKIPRKLPPRSR